MTRLSALTRRFLHCLFHLHRAETGWAAGTFFANYIGCECGRVFLGQRPWYYKR